MSTAARRDFRYVNQVDREGRPEAAAVLGEAGDRMIIRHGGMDLRQAATRLEGHIARLDNFARQLGKLDPEGKARQALDLLKSLERDIEIAARSTQCRFHELDISPSGAMAMCRNCGFVGRWRDGMWERVEPATSSPAFRTAAQQAASDLRAVAAAESAADAASPLLVLGQGDYRREVCGDPRTGRLLDVRA
jgi:hypothetical protein